MMTGPESGPQKASQLREVRYEHSGEFPDILQQLGVSLLVSTYQAGKLVAIGEHGGQLKLSFHNFDQAMGIAVHPQRISVGGRSQIWQLESTPDIIQQWNDGAEHDACYLARSSQITEEIHGHEMAWCGEELWIVNTKFSCLCTLQSPYSFVPRWRPPFISELAAEDRCHLNGLCVVDGVPRYVSAMAESDVAGGWRPTKAVSGCMIDITTGETIARGFAMPHSPRYYGGQFWILDSGRGELVSVDTATGTFETVAAQPGYTRGLDFSGPIAFIGLSKIRETSTFGGVPIAENRDQLKCGVAAVDLRSGRHLAHFEFMSGIEEIFDIRVLPTSRNPLITGPMVADADAKPVWYAPSSIVPTQLTLRLPPINDSVAATDDSRGNSTVSDIHSSPSQPSLAQRFAAACRCADNNEFAAAATQFRAILAESPEHINARWNLGVAEHFLGEIDASVKTLRVAIEQAPELPAAHLNLAMSLFLQRNFAEAWKEYEWRWRCERFPIRAAPQVAPTWQGEPLGNKTILIYGEQGIGDEIMFASAFPALLYQAKHCIIACRDRLVPLFERSFPTATIVDHKRLNGCDFPQAPDFQIASGSLLRHVRPAFDPDGALSRFLLPSPQHVERCQERLAELGPGQRIGISWRGGRDRAEAMRRSTAPTQWAELLRMPQVQFVNLQYGVANDELDEFEASSGIRPHHWEDINPLEDLEEFTALVHCLDRVITIDNSTGHLAGALGVPTWLLISFPSASHWRWLLDEERCVWYQSMELVRRTDQDSWETIFADLARRLK